MTEPSQKHWTDDEELLEQYLLGQLHADRKHALDTHLEACDRCRSVVSSHEELSSGIRRFGRDEVKSRLSIRVAEYRQSRKNWYRHAGLAAGILLFFAVGIRDDWYLGLERQRGDWRDQADSLRQRLHSVPRGILYPPDDPLGNAPINEMKEAAMLAAPPANGAEPYDTVFFWLKGAFVGGPFEKAPTHSPEGNVVAPASQEAKAHTKGLARIGEPKRTQRFRPDPDQLTLVQRPLSEFPLRGEPMLNPPHAVPAQLRIVGPRTHLTFFLDPLFTPSEVLAATVEIVRPDSIVVAIGGRRIGYLVPPNVLKVVPRKSGK